MNYNIFDLCILEALNILISTLRYFHMLWNEVKTLYYQLVKDFACILYSELAIYWYRFQQILFVNEIQRNKRTASSYPIFFIPKNFYHLQNYWRNCEKLPWRCKLYSIVQLFPMSKEPCFTLVRSFKRCSFYCMQKYIHPLK